MIPPRLNVPLTVPPEGGVINLQKARAMFLKKSYHMNSSPGLSPWNEPSELFIHTVYHALGLIGFLHCRSSSPSWQVLTAKLVAPFQEGYHGKMEWETGSIVLFNLF